MGGLLESINQISGVLGSAILEKDGSVREMNFAEGISSSQLLWFSEKAHSICGLISNSLGSGEVQRITLDGTLARLLVYELLDGIALVFTEKNANIGLLRLNLERLIPNNVCSSSME